MTIFKYKYGDLFNPTIKAIHNLEGSATIPELEEEVAKILQLTDEELNIVHKGNRTKFSYRLAWARTHLKTYGILENSIRGVWSLTIEGQKTKSVDKKLVKKLVRKQYLETRKTREVPEIEDSTGEIIAVEWQEELIKSLQTISPKQFERLSQRMLREIGFVNVEVTGKSGDGGIDGKGVLKIGGVLSFHVVFQCKRYKGSISPSIIRDFRGAMVGRADKGLFCTTGTFTREAKREAQRDGAPPIDLMDGFQFAEKLKELNLGIEIITEEKIKIKKNWFENL